MRLGDLPNGPVGPQQFDKLDPCEIMVAKAASGQVTHGAGTQCPRYPWAESRMRLDQSSSRARRAEVGRSHGTRRSRARRGATCRSPVRAPCTASRQSVDRRTHRAPSPSSRSSHVRSGAIPYRTVACAGWALPTRALSEGDRQRDRALRRKRALERAHSLASQAEVWHGDPRIPHAHHQAS